MKKEQIDRDSSFDRLTRDALRARMSQASTVSDTSDTGCLDADTLAAWADRKLGSADRSAAEAHLADCVRCQAMLAAMARTTPASTAAPPWWRLHLIGWLVPVSVAAALIVWSVVTARPTFETREPDTRAATPEASASPPVIARAEPPPAPADERRDAAPNALEKEQAAARPAPAKTEAPTPMRSRDAVAETRAKAMADTMASAAPPPVAPARAPSAPLAAPSPALPGASATAASPPAPAPPTANREAFGAAADARASALMTRQLVVGPGAAIASPNSLTRWRPLPGGSVQHSSDGGSTWRVQQTGVTTTLTAGASPSALVCWLIGPRGLVLLSVDAETWKQVSLAEPIDLVSIRAVDDKGATVTASDGRAFTTVDGGATWRPR